MQKKVMMDMVMTVRMMRMGVDNEIQDIMDHGIRFSTISSIKPKSCKDHNVYGADTDDDDYDGRDGQFDKNTITLNQQNPSTHIL